MKKKKWNGKNFTSLSNGRVVSNGPCRYIRPEIGKQKTVSFRLTKAIHEHESVTVNELVRRLNSKGPITSYGTVREALLRHPYLFEPCFIGNEVFYSKVS